MSEIDLSGVEAVGDHDECCGHCESGCVMRPGCGAEEAQGEDARTTEVELHGSGELRLPLRIVRDEAARGSDRFRLLDARGVLLAHGPRLSYLEALVCAVTEIGALRRYLAAMSGPSPTVERVTARDGVHPDDLEVIERWERAVDRDFGDVVAERDEARDKHRAAVAETGALRDGVTGAIGLLWREVPRPFGGVGLVCPDDREVVEAVRQVVKERDEARERLQKAEQARSEARSDERFLADELARHTGCEIAEIVEALSAHRGGQPSVSMPNRRMVEAARARQLAEAERDEARAEVKALREWRALVCEAAGGAPPKDVPELVAKIGRRYVERADEIRDLRAKLAQAEAELADLRAVVEAVPCGGCERPAVTRNASDVPVCAECARDPDPVDDDDDGGSELDAAPVAEPTRGPKVGDRVTAANVGMLPVGTVVEWMDDGPRAVVRTDTDAWEDPMWGRAGSRSDAEMVAVASAHIRSFPQPVTATAPTAKGCRGCAYRVGQTIECIAHRHLSDAASRALDDWTRTYLDGDSDDVTPLPGAPECPARVEATAPALGCHGCRWDRDTACAIPAIHPAAPDAAEWSGTHLEGDGMTPRAGAPECPGRGEA